MRKIIVLLMVMCIFTFASVTQVFAGDEDIPCPMSIELPVVEEK